MSVTIVTAGLFCLGLFGVLTRRDVIAVLASVELMLGAANVQLVAQGVASGRGEAQALALFVLVIAAAEAAVGLALLLAAVRRSGRSRVDELAEVQG